MRRPSRWSLRTRLLALVLALLAAVSAGIVGITAVVLRDYLVQQVDNRVNAADTRWAKPRGGPGHTPDSALAGSAAGSQAPTGDGTVPADNQPGMSFPGEWTPAEFVALSGQPIGTMAARIIDGEAVTAVILGPGAVPSPLPASLAKTLLSIPHDASAHTYSLGAYGNYRLTARQIDNGTVVISGFSLSDVDATVNQLVIVAGIVAGAGVLLLGVVGAVTVRRTLRPLRRVAATARRVAELPLDHGEVALDVRVPALDTDPRTEVGQVGAALNHMIDHVGAALEARHASETRVRQFVADASHELRTPLAAISGYAQLTRRGQAAVPADVAYALSRVESESARMTRLVEDLLLLARLDSGRPLEYGCVDLSRLVVDVLSDAHIAAPGHRFHLDLPSQAVMVHGDQARLHQVLANLLANARTHTPPGTSVTVALEVPPPFTPGGQLRLSVVDNGPGIAPELLPHIFERFARGDSSRSRAAGSTGLGLAIVSAVVEAHGGHITVRSVPGRTAFVVTLPYLPAPPLADEDDDLPEAEDLDLAEAEDLAGWPAGAYAPHPGTGVSAYR